MKRQNRFLIALLSAGITFATLTASFGTDHWKRWNNYRHGYFHHYDQHHDHDHDHWKGGDSEAGEEDNSDTQGK